MTLERSDIEMLGKVTSAAAVGLFAAQANGLLAFPAGTLTIGEIESKLALSIEAFLARAAEIDGAA